MLIFDMSSEWWSVMVSLCMSMICLCVVLHGSSRSPHWAWVSPSWPSSLNCALQNCFCHIRRRIYCHIRAQRQIDNAVHEVLKSIQKRHISLGGSQWSETEILVWFGTGRWSSNHNITNDLTKAQNLTAVSDQTKSLHSTLHHLYHSNCAGPCMQSSSLY